MMMEVMGLHMPGAAFINPGTKLRSELTRAAVHRLAHIGWDGDDYRTLSRCIDEKAIVNAIIGLLATGGSTNHAIHLPAIARAAGISVTWTEFAELAAMVKLMYRVSHKEHMDMNHINRLCGMYKRARNLIIIGKCT